MLVGRKPPRCLCIATHHQHVTCGKRRSREWLRALAVLDGDAGETSVVFEINFVSRLANIGRGRSHPQPMQTVVEPVLLDERACVSKTPSLWVLQYSVNTFLIVGFGSKPYAFRLASTTFHPPFGMIARLSGASVWRPTISSRSLSMYPGACAKMLDGSVYETSRTPFSRSCASRGRSFSHTLRVRAVGPARNEAPLEAVG